MEFPKKLTLQPVGAGDKDLVAFDEDGDGNTDAEISMVLTLSKTFNLK